MEFIYWEQLLDPHLCREETEAKLGTGQACHPTELQAGRDFQNYTAFALLGGGGGGTGCGSGQRGVTLS